ncbi:MAG: hypothetical protein ACUZ8O_14310 [Candidatus Anammoxibacter sp.]
MPALEVLTAIGTAVDSVLTAMTAVNGDSLTIRNAPVDSEINLMAAWAFNQSAGDYAIRSPELHDNTQGIKFRAVANEIKNSLPEMPLQKLFPQANLTVLGSGDTVSGDIQSISMLIYYANLPGISARLITIEELISKAVELATLTNTITALATGQRSAGEPINSETDILKANTDYALLGATIEGSAACIGYTGADFGNLRVGFPGDENTPDLTKDFFVRLARTTGKAVIPVFNSANADNLLIDVLGNENTTESIIDTMLARLTS